LVINDLWIVGLTALWMFVPGMALAAAVLGRPSFWMIPAGPPLTILMLAWMGIAFSGAGENAIHVMRLATVGVTVLLLVVAIARIRFWARKKTFGPPSIIGRRVRIAAAAGVAAGIVLGVATMSTSDQWIQGVPQFFDAPWHGYLIATIESRGLTAPWQLVPLDTYTTTALTPYPYGLHLLAAVSDITSAPNVALNSVKAVGSIFVAATGAAALAASVFGRRYLAIAFLPIALMLLPAFQLRVAGLPPYALGITLMPVAIAFLLRLRDRTGISGIVLAAGSLAAIVVVQPAVLVLVVVAATPPLIAALFGSGRRQVLINTTLTMLLFLAVAAPWIIQSLHSASSVLAVIRPAIMDYRLALGAILTDVEGGFTIPWLLVGLSLLGVILSILGRLPRWLSFSWILAVALYVVAAAGPDRLRQVVSGPFFTDWYRIAPLATLLLATLAAGTLSVLVEVLHARVRWSTSYAVVAVSVAVAVVAVQVTLSDRSLLAPRAGGLIVVPGEVAAYRVIAPLVPRGSQVLNDWRDGSTWLYTLDGAPVLNPWNATVQASQERHLLLGHFAEIGKWPKVDQALLNLNVRSVVVSQSRLSGKIKSIRIPANSPYVHLVRNFGDTQFYSVDLDLLAKYVGVAAPSLPTDDFRAP
jgi:hypothetical protein